MRLGRHRILALVVASIAAASSGAAAVNAATPAVLLAGGAASVRDVSVSVTVEPPSGPASWLRLSLDGGATWVERSYAVSFAVSLIDAAAGGVDADGVKVLTVESGDGSGSWSALGSDSILLDRAGPVINTVGNDISSGWDGSYSVDVSDAGVGVHHTDVSLDDVHWRLFDPSPVDWRPGSWIDFREGTIGGSWEPGPRTVHLRSVDRLGNVGPEYTFTTSAGGPLREADLPAVFEFPRPAVTGALFTIKPVFDAGYSIPSGAFCVWTFRAGTFAERLQAQYGPTFIGIEFNVPPKNGLCEPWTFTLPYTATLEYTWSLSVQYPNGVWLGGQGGLAGSFRATAASSSRAVTTSNLPLYYIVPDRDYVADDGTVTYRVYRAGGAPERTGLWSCQPADYDGPWPLVPEEQKGGTSFRCHVDSAGPWEADWYFERNGHRWLASYDPIGDPNRPRVSAPVVRPGGVGALSTTAQPVTVVWSGRDKGTGIARYQLQRSVNGRPFSAVALPSRLATMVDLRLATGSSYRFRVRAQDRAGNWSTWAYSTPTRPVLYQEGSAGFTWSTAWHRAAAPGASGGAVRAATAAGATARFRFSGHAVGWIAARGPGNGFARVYVDGALVATVNLEASGRQPPRVVWRQRWSKVGTHVVTVKVLGSGGRPRVEIDAMEVLR